MSYLIDTTRLASVLGRREVVRVKSVSNGNGGSTRVSIVSAEVLAEITDERCRCEELGLRAGMPVKELIVLGSGCTGETMFGARLRPAREPGWVCNRLDRIRRRYGK